MGALFKTLAQQHVDLRVVQGQNLQCRQRRIGGRKHGGNRRENEGVRRQDQTSSWKLLMLAGMVITGTVVQAESVGPAPLDMPISAMITEFGVSCTRRVSSPPARTGSL